MNVKDNIIIFITNSNGPSKNIFPKHFIRNFDVYFINLYTVILQYRDWNIIIFFISILFEFLFRDIHR